MVSFPNAKINLGLNITEKRADGFHNIESCFYPVPWKDVLEVIPADATQFQSTGIRIPPSKNGNLCLQAYELLKADFDLPEVSIHLHKIIPIGAGLGGGSADGTFVLKLLNERFGLKIPDSKLEKYALKLGSDCPFFVQNKPILVSGRGEVFRPIELDLSGIFVTLVNPSIHISTKEAYSGIVPKPSDIKLGKLLMNDYSEWKANLKNDFEASLFDNYPALPKIKEMLYESGCFYASMTGSGSTLFGLSERKIETTQFGSYTVFEGKL